MKIQNALVSYIFDRSQRYFAHVTTVTLSWRVQNIVVIGRVYFTLECFEFSSNFEFDRNMLSGTGTWSRTWNARWEQCCHLWLGTLVDPKSCAWGCQAGYRDTTSHRRHPHFGFYVPEEVRGKTTRTSQNTQLYGRFLLITHESLCIYCL